MMLASDIDLTFSGSIKAFKQWLDLLDALEELMIVANYGS